MSSQDKSAAMREASGAVDSTDRLVMFLYYLGRDHLPLGKIEKVIDECLPEGIDVAQFCNGWLATWAKDAAGRLGKRGSL